MPPTQILDMLIRSHGFWFVMRQALAARARAKRAARARRYDLPDHMRRDIGLPELPKAPQYGVPPRF